MATRETRPEIGPRASTRRTWRAFREAKGEHASETGVKYDAAETTSSSRRHQPHENLRRGVNRRRALGFARSIFISRTDRLVLVSSASSNPRRSRIPPSRDSNEKFMGGSGSFNSFDKPRRRSRARTRARGDLSARCKRTWRTRTASAPRTRSRGR
eukprot:23889-Pelagococcus_subviridis.AAC.5